MGSIKNFVPKHFKTGDGTLLKALLSGIDQLAGRLQKMIEAGIDQRFLTTASGRYLLFLGEQEGFAMPPNSGLDIRALRALIPAMVASPKQVVSTLNKLIEIFYNTDRVKPSVVSTVSEPYNLLDGDDLIVETESGRTSVSLLADQLSDITSVSATELAGVINNAQNLYTADVFLDTRTNRRFLRLISNAYGTRAFIRIAGGALQNVAQFPKLVNTTQYAGITWDVTKEATYTDVTRFTWSGVGTNPRLYNAKVGDIVTIRGLVDGAEELSRLNGSFEIVDVGYDYFVVRNPRFPFTSATVTQPEDNTLFFTASDKSTLYDLEEFAILSETQDATTTITVPAIPPLARRFLSGSAHLQGAETPILDFTRSSITVDDTFAYEPPVDDNVFTITTQHQRLDARIVKQIKTSDSNGLTPRTYILDGSDSKYGVLPFTTPQLCGNNALYAEPGSEFFFLNCPFKHGLETSWGFTVSAPNLVGNITSGMIDKEHLVLEATSDFQVKFKIYDSDGLPIRFSGVQFDDFEVYRHPVPQADGSDFYLEFPDASDVIASGLAVNDVFRIDGSLGTTVEPFFGERLRHARLLVKSIDGVRVNFSAGFGTGYGGLIIEDGTAYRSAHFGGAVTYFFDKVSAHNQDFVMTTLFATWLGYTPSLNENYVGSFLFDPSGDISQNTVSGTIVKNQETILKGSNQFAIFVDTVEGLPNSGHVILNYGSHIEEGPIFYFSVIESTTGFSQILIDPSYQFKNTHSVGTNVQYVHRLAPYNPTEDGSDYPAYVTGTAQARNTLLTLLRLLIATGVFLDFQVLLPNLKYDDPAIQPFE